MISAEVLAKLHEMNIEDLKVDKHTGRGHWARDEVLW